MSLTTPFSVQKLQTALHAKAKELLDFRGTKEAKMGIPGSNCRLSFMGLDVRRESQGDGRYFRIR
jgi:hypothetical protein